MFKAICVPYHSLVGLIHAECRQLVSQQDSAEPRFLDVTDLAAESVLECIVGKRVDAAFLRHSLSKIEHSIRGTSSKPRTIFLSPNLSVLNLDDLVSHLVSMFKVLNFRTRSECEVVIYFTEDLKQAIKAAQTIELRTRASKNKSIRLLDSKSYGHPELEVSGDGQLVLSPDEHNVVLLDSLADNLSDNVICSALNIANNAGITIHMSERTASRAAQGDGVQIHITE